jgi:hypothetical protein
MLISMRAYARQRGVSEGAVRKAVRRGKITLVGGQVDPEQADAQWEHNRDAMQASKMSASIEKTESLIEPAPALPVPVAVQQQPLDLLPAGSMGAVQRQHVAAKVKLAEMKVRQLEGELLPVAEVEQAWSDLVATAQSTLLAVADKVAHRLSISRDEAECRSIVDREIRDALLALSRYRPQVEHSPAA